MKASEAEEAKSEFDEIDRLCCNNIGVLAAEAVQKANSGHPGAPMGMAAIAHVLWTKFLIANPKNSGWINRDRFILSNGHGCALQYTMLHLLGYKVSLNDLKEFRQLNSITPGHPENHLTDGVEVSTGPLGQGIAQGVGSAIASKYAQSIFGKELINNKTYVFCGDGCMQEGVASEACSLAGHLKLNNLILIYDDNHIQIDGTTDLAFTENVGERFKSYGWNVLYVEDGNLDPNKGASLGNLDKIAKAIEIATKSEDKPTLICIKTVIGYCSSKANTHGVHGSPLKDALSGYKKAMGFTDDESFVIKDGVIKRYQDTFGKRGQEAESKWNELSAKCEKADLLKRLLAGKLPEKWMDVLPKYDETSKENASRSINGEILNAIAKVIPEIIGGAADLTPSTKTQLACSHDFQATSYDGRYLRFGVREFAMFAIGNGIASFGLNFIPFTATFLNFITYGYGAVRLGALSELRQIYIMTHDSVLLGEDGPTHQPVEVLPACRALPNLLTFRPADGNEICETWKIMLNRVNGPSVICLSRQKIATNTVSKYTKNTAGEGVKCGAYVLNPSTDEEKATDPDVIAIATGSEVELALKAAEKLSGSINVRVVSGVCLELFELQDLKYKQSVLKPNTLVVSLEASSPYGWDRYSHKAFGVPAFGKSAPLADIRKDFEFTAELFEKNIKKTCEAWKDKQIPLLPVLY